MTTEKVEKNRSWSKLTKFAVGIEDGTVSDNEKAVNDLLWDYFGRYRGQRLLYYARMTLPYVIAKWRDEHTATRGPDGKEENLGRWQIRGNTRDLQKVLRPPYYPVDLAFYDGVQRLAITCCIPKEVVDGIETDEISKEEMKSYAVRGCYKILDGGWEIVVAEEDLVQQLLAAYENKETDEVGRKLQFFEVWRRQVLNLADFVRRVIIVYGDAKEGVPVDQLEDKNIQPNA
jgi:hypothetical protein